MNFAQRLLSDTALRATYGIAGTTEELEQFSLHVAAYGQTGFPVCCVPFGAGTHEEGALIPDMAVLRQSSEALLQAGLGLVHVFKVYKG